MKKCHASQKPTTMQSSHLQLPPNGPIFLTRRLQPLYNQKGRYLPILGKCRFFKCLYFKSLRMPQRKYFAAKGIIVFDFVFFIGVLFRENSKLSTLVQSRHSVLHVLKADVDIHIRCSSRRGVA